MSINLKADCHAPHKRIRLNKTQDQPNPNPPPNSKYIPLEAMLIKNGEGVGGANYVHR